MSQSQYTEFEINEDLSAVKEFSGDGGGAPALPPGEFIFDVVSLTQGTSKTNNPKIEVTFEVAEGEYTGTRLTNNYSLQSQALGRLKKLMMACGAQLDKIRSSEIIGARIRAAVVHNEGKQQLGPDGGPKCDANGEPYPPRVFANIANERPLEEAQPVVAAAPPPPVTRKATTPAARRA
jgi:hypothetical protein